MYILFFLCGSFDCSARFSEATLDPTEAPRCVSETSPRPPFVAEHTLGTSSETAVLPLIDSNLGMLQKTIGLS